MWAVFVKLIARHKGLAWASSQVLRRLDSGLPSHGEEVYTSSHGSDTISSLLYCVIFLYQNSIELRYKVICMYCMLT